MKLTKSHPRDDYKEMIELVLIFLGEGDFEIKKPGPTSHARWMGKALHSHKIFIFRSQFRLTKRETDGLRDICLFIVKLYVQVWFECTNAISAPLLDLNFIQKAMQYSEIDAAISATILKKMSNHLWYISEETVVLAFFDKNVTFEEKRKMVANLHSQEPVVKLKDGRTHLNLKTFKNYSLSDFVSKKNTQFFNQFGLSTAFLERDPATWKTAFDYEEGWSFCRDLLVVNDT